VITAAHPFVSCQPRGALAAYAALLLHLVLMLPGSLSAGVQGACTPCDSALVLDAALPDRCAGHSATPASVGAREDQAGCLDPYMNRAAPVGPSKELQLHRAPFPCVCSTPRRQAVAGAGSISAAFVGAAVLGVRSPARACLLNARPRGVAAFLTFPRACSSAGRALTPTAQRAEAGTKELSGVTPRRISAARPYHNQAGAAVQPVAPAATEGGRA